MIYRVAVVPHRPLNNTRLSVLCGFGGTLPINRLVYEIAPLPTNGNPASEPESITLKFECQNGHIFEQDFRAA